MSGFGMLSFHRQSSSYRITKSGSFQSPFRLKSGRSSAEMTGQKPVRHSEERKLLSQVQVGTRAISNQEKDMHVNERRQSQTGIPAFEVMHDLSRSARLQLVAVLSCLTQRQPHRMLIRRFFVRV